MRYSALFFLVFLVITNTLFAQTRAELEERRNKTLNDIGYIDNLIKSTAQERKESLNSIRIIGKKLDLRESVIKDMLEEISLIAERIDLNTLAIEMMQDDLIELKEDYARAIVNSYKSGKGNPKVVFILSAKDFNQAYKRIKYLQQVAKYRRKESEIIHELKNQIEATKEKLQADLYKISDLKTKQEQQKGLLQNEQEKEKAIVKSLTKREKELKKEYDDKKRIAKKIENEIFKIIEEEKRLAKKSEITPERKLAGNNFTENKGRLPWPVDSGIITSHFGIHKHAIFKYVTENNLGIEITSSEKAVARSIFNGVVTKIYPIEGENITIFINHGNYWSVYMNLVNVKVKRNDVVTTKQELGEVYSDPRDNNNCVIKLMIVEENAKFLDPELWIAKK